MFKVTLSLAVLLAVSGLAGAAETETQGGAKSPPADNPDQAMTCQPVTDPDGVSLGRTICADVVALDQMLVYNRFGSFNPFGMIFALRNDVVPMSAPIRASRADECDEKLGTETLAGDLRAGEVRLKDCKRPRPMVLRANVGDVLHVRMTNLLIEHQPGLSADFCRIDRTQGAGATTPRPAVSTNATATHGPALCPQLGRGDAGQDEGGDWPRTRGMNFAVQGLLAFDPAGGQPDPACLGLTALLPGQSGDCYYRIEREGPFFLTSTAAPSGGEGDGGSMTHGLFGAVLAQKTGSEWFRSQISTTAFLAFRQNFQDRGVLADVVSGAFDLGAYRETRDEDGQPVLAMLRDEGNGAFQLVHSDLNAVVANPALAGDPRNPGPQSPAAFREFGIFFHDELKTFFTQNFEELQNFSQLAGVRDGFAINYGASGMGAILLANRKGIGPSAGCAECLYEEFFLTSWANGDPALLEQYSDDPSNVHHSYLNDPVVFRNFHAGPKETHVFHLHAHQWFAGNDQGRGAFLDSQTVGPQQAFTYAIDGGRMEVYHPASADRPGWLETLGSGNRNRTVGDSIFHCHLYPHFAQGMWELWRVHDVLEDGSRKLPDGQEEPGLSLEQPELEGGALAPIKRRDGSVDHATGRLNPVPARGSDYLGTPIPGLVPLPGEPWPLPPTYVPDAAETAVAQDIDAFPGYPFYIAGKPGHRPPQAPMDLAREIAINDPDSDADDALTQTVLDGGLPRHVVADGARRAFPFDIAKVEPTLTSTDRRQRESAQAQVVAKALALGDMTMKLESAPLALLDYDGTPMERAAMRFHGDGTGLTLSTADGRPVTQQEGIYLPAGATRGFAVNGSAPKPGAPFADPCSRPARLRGPNLPGDLSDPFWRFDAASDRAIAPTPGFIGFRRYEASAVQLDIVTNRAGWHDPQSRINVLTTQAPRYKDGGDPQGDRRLRDWPLPDEARPDSWAPVVSADDVPFYFRALSGECIEFRHRNELPHVLELDDFQVRTPTDTIGQHIHLVKFDVTSSDGSANGFNYEDGTFAPDEIAHRICAAKAEGMATEATAGRNGRLALGEAEGLCDADNHVSPRFADRIWRLSSQEWPDLFQTTVQRWFADPIRSGAGPDARGTATSHDRTLRTVFSHDHFGASSIQQHGFYTALVIEPQQAEICDPADPANCTRMRPANDRTLRLSDASLVGDRKAMRDRGALNPQDENFREFALAVADFALLYDPRDRVTGRARTIADAATKGTWARQMPSDHGKGLGALFCEGMNPAAPGRCGLTEEEEGALVPAAIAAGHDPQYPKGGRLTRDLLTPAEIAIRYADDLHPAGRLTLGDHLLRWRRMAAGYQPHDAGAPLARPVSAPDRPESISVSHHDPYLVNYKGEPLPLRFGTSSRSGDDCRLTNVRDWLDPLVAGTTTSCRISRQDAWPKGDPALAFVSLGEADHGDPALRPLAVNEGDRVMIRLIQGAQEVQHAFAIEGFTFPRNLDHAYPSAVAPTDDNIGDATLALACRNLAVASGGMPRDYRAWERQEKTRDPAFWHDYETMLARCFNGEGRIAAQEIGISEHFEFTGAYIAGSNAAARSFVDVTADDRARMVAEIQRERPHGDNLVHFGSVDALWNGAWTFLRVHDRPEIISPLQPDEITRREALDQNRPDGQAETVIRALLNDQAPTMAAGDDAGLEAQGRDLLSLLDLDPPAPFDPDPPTVLVPPAECRGPMVEATVVAVSARRAFPTSGGTSYSDQLIDPDGLFLALIDPDDLKGQTEGDYLKVIRDTYTRPEPLVLPVKAGECLKVQWVNLLTRHMRSSGLTQGLMDHRGDAAMPTITSLNIDMEPEDGVRPSARLAISLALPVIGDLRNMPNPFGITQVAALAPASGQNGTVLKRHDSSPGADNSNAQIMTVEYYAGRLIYPRAKTQKQILRDLFAEGGLAGIAGQPEGARQAVLRERLDALGFGPVQADALLPQAGEDEAAVLARLQQDVQPAAPLLQRNAAKNAVSVLAASQAHYVPYAFGAIPIRPTADIIQHPMQGMIGAVLVMPADATELESSVQRTTQGAGAILKRTKQTEDPRPVWVTRIDTTDPEGGRHSLRQFTLFWQDGLNFRQSGTPVPNCAVCDDSYDKGEAGVNMNSEPFDLRLRRDGARDRDNRPVRDSDLNRYLFGPQTAKDGTKRLDFYRLRPNETPDNAPMTVLRATEGEEITVHVVHPGGRARQRAFIMIGQDYDDLFHGFGFPRAALLAPGKSMTAQILHHAQPGCYPWFDGPTTLRAGGVWGLLDVVPAGAAPEMTNCRRDPVSR